MGIESASTFSAADYLSIRSLIVSVYLELYLQANAQNLRMSAALRLENAHGQMTTLLIFFGQKTWLMVLGITDLQSITPLYHLLEVMSTTTPMLTMYQV